MVLGNIRSLTFAAAVAACSAAAAPALVRAQGQGQGASQSLPAQVSALQAKVSSLQAQVDALGGGVSSGGLLTAGGQTIPGIISYSSNSFGTRNAEAEVLLPLPRAGRLTSLVVYVRFNGLTSTASFRVRVNGADSPLQISVPAGATGVSVVEVDVAIAAGDLVAVKIDATGSVGTDIAWKALYTYVTP